MNKLLTSNYILRSCKFGKFSIIIYGLCGYKYTIDNVIGYNLNKKEFRIYYMASLFDVNSSTKIIPCDSFISFDIINHIFRGEVTL